MVQPVISLARFSFNKGVLPMVSARSLCIRMGLHPWFVPLGVGGTRGKLKDWRKIVARTRRALPQRPGQEIKPNSDPPAGQQCALTERSALPAGLISALSGLWMARSYDIAAQDNALLHAMRLTFGSAMLVSLCLGLAAILRRDVARHRVWMMRGYAIGIGAVTQAFTNLPWIVAFGFPSPMADARLMGAGWVINLAVVEWVIHRNTNGSPIFTFS